MEESLKNISLYQFKIDKEYKEYLDDLVRMGTIQVIVNIMFFITNPMDNKMFSQMFAKTLLFILIGVSAYWLILRKLILFV